MVSEKQRLGDWRAGMGSDRPAPAPGACPRCGHGCEGEVECPRCGVLLAKARARAESLVLPLEMHEEPVEPRDWRRTALAGLGLVAAVWASSRFLVPTPDPPPRAAVRVAPPTTLEAEPPQPVDAPNEMEQATAEPSPDPGNALLASNDVPPPDAGPVPRLETRRTPPSPAATPDPNLVNLRARLRDGDWAGAEDAAIAVLKTTPRLPEAMCGLGQALFCQDRSREAIEAIKECAEYSVAIGDRQNAANLLRTVEGSLAPEKGLEELKSEHFKVRFDGEAHESIGRDVLSSLERQYSTVANALDHRPRGMIPVVLFKGARYVGATGSSGSLGAYSSHDGRIRINMAGLDSGISTELEKTLIHEMTHAFAGDLGGATVPREVHEGLAQYMEGERVGNRLPASLVDALTRGGGMSVYDFYQGALSYVEHLIGLRGMSGVHELLRVMGEKHNADRAFDEVYGKSSSELRKAWLGQLRAS